MKRLTALLLCLILILPLAACGFSSGSEVEKNLILSAYVDKDNVATLVCDSGKILTIPDAKGAYVSRDRKNMIWLSTDDILKCVPFRAEKTDLNKSERIAEDVDALLTLSNTGACFRNKDAEVFRVLLTDKSLIKFAKEVSVINSNANTDLFYAMDGKLYYLAHDSEDSQVIGSFEGSVDLRMISENSSELIWIDSDTSSRTDTVYYFNGTESEKLFETNNNGYTSSTIVEKSPSGDYVVVYSYDDSLLMLKAPGKDFVKVNLKSEIAFDVYSKDGALSDISSKIDGIYAAASNDGYEAVYWVSFDGDREKVLSKVSSFSVSQGFLYYLDEENTLYKVPAGGATIGESERIATEVDDFEVSNGYLYYMKDTEELKDTDYCGIGTLYAYPPKASAPMRIASDVYARYFSFYSMPDSIDCCLFIADGGKTVLYLKNPENHGYFFYGSLFRYTSGDKEPVRIMSDVFEFYINSNTSKLHSDHFTFARYIDDESSEGTDFYDWYFYNGKEAVCVARSAS